MISKSLIDQRRRAKVKRRCEEVVCIDGATVSSDSEGLGSRKEGCFDSSGANHPESGLAIAIGGVSWR